MADYTDSTGEAASVTSVTALLCWESRGELIAGIGSSLHIFTLPASTTQSFTSKDDEAPVDRPQRIQVFPRGHKIHGITCRPSENVLAVFGDRILAVADQVLTHGAPGTASRHASWQATSFRMAVLDRWIWDVLPFQRGRLAVSLARSQVRILTDGLKEVLRYQCTDTELTWSSKLIARSDPSWEHVVELLVAGGTSRGKLLVWRVNELSPTSSIVLDRPSSIVVSPEFEAESHQGSIFAVDSSPDGTVLVTAGDDRSFRVWRAIRSNPLVFQSTACIYSHTGRVWKTLLITPRSSSASQHIVVVTASEDATCRIWDESSGRVRLLCTHRGKNVRALAQASDCIFSGGDDGAIYRCLLFNTPLIWSTSPPFDHDAEVAQGLTFITDTTVVVSSSRGALYLLTRQVSGHVDLPAWETIYSDDENISFAQGSLASFGSIILVAGDVCGNVVLLDWQAPQVEKGDRSCLKWKAVDRGQVLYLSLDEEGSSLVASGWNGSLFHWRWHSTTTALSSRATLLGTYVNPSRHPIYCAWLSTSKGFLLAGDKTGTVLLFQLVEGGNQEKLELLSPRKRIKAFESRVVDIQPSWSCNEFGQDNGTPRWFIVAASEGEIIECVVDSGLMDAEVVGKRKRLGRIGRISRLVCNGAEVLVIGFISTHFVVLKLDTGEEVFDVVCGGWRRPHAVRVSRDSIGKVAFAFWRSGKIVWASRPSNSSSHISPPFHGMRVNAAVCPLSNSNSLLIVSGGEDSTLRISEINPATMSISHLQTLDAHRGGISCLASTGGVYSKILLVSGGGHGEIYLWDQLDSVRFKLVGSLVLDQGGALKARPRVTCAAILNIEGECLVICGTSQGSLVGTLWRQFDMRNSAVPDLFVQSKEGACRCLSALSGGLLVSGHTTGALLVWRVHLDSGFELLYRRNTHSLGVNGVCSVIEGATLFVFSGGDDGTVCLVLHEISSLEPREISYFQGHSAAITGVWTDASSFVSVGADQKVVTYQRSMCNLALVSSTLTSVCDPSTVVVSGARKLIFGMGVEMFSEPAS